MANRRLARGARTSRKKKAKAAKKEASSGNSHKAASELATTSAKKSFFVGGGSGLQGGKMKLSGKLKGKAASLQSQITATTKRRSLLRKQQVREKRALKDHTAELERRKLSIRKGDTAKQERRELGKYIRQLKEEQRVKHASELANVEEELKRLMDAEEQRKTKKGKAGAQGNEEDDSDNWEDVAEIGSDDSIDEEGLQNMFAHLIA